MNDALFPNDNDKVILGVIDEARGKEAVLEEILRGYRSLIVAFSGGVDSTYLAVVASRVLGERSLAVTAQSPSLAPEEFEEAAALARQFGIIHRVVETAELQNENYASNPINRCYFCKTEMMGHLVHLAAKEGYERIALGAIMDDLSDFRPGEQASTQHGAVFPLREAKMTKLDIRMLSREMGLPTADKPGSACLASRIPFGERVTGEKLDRVAQAETLLHRLGFRACRVRHHQQLARIEVTPVDLSRLVAHRDEIVASLKSYGFTYVTMDLQGLRSGSLHEAVRKP